MKILTLECATYSWLKSILCRPNRTSFKAYSLSPVSVYLHLSGFNKRKEGKSEFYRVSGK